MRAALKGRAPRPMELPAVWAATLTTAVAPFGPIALGRALTSVDRWESLANLSNGEPPQVGRTHSATLSPAD